VRVAGFTWNGWQPSAVYAPDAWIDHSKTKVGYEIPLNRHFYVYEPPRPLEEIAGEISQLEKEIVAMLAEIV
uniref:hypothetical protein n=1 Tax=Alcanivorax profundi TaxID=2338368 RepID=UPI0032B1778C